MFSCPIRSGVLFLSMGPFPLPTDAPDPVVAAFDGLNEAEMVLDAFGEGGGGGGLQMPPGGRPSFKVAGVKCLAGLGTVIQFVKIFKTFD